MVRTLKRTIRLLKVVLAVHPFLWSVAGVVLIVDAIWIHWGGYRVLMRDVLVNGGALIFILGLAGMAREVGYILYEYGHEAKSRKALYISDAAGAIAAYSCFSSIGIIFSYLCVTLNFPLIDSYLIRFDSMLGFDWVRLYKWVHSHHDVKVVLAFAYSTILWQSAAIPVALGLLGRREDLAKYVFCIILSTFLAIFISTPFPAKGAFIHFNISDPRTSSTTSYFAPLRSEVMRILEFEKMQELIAMPSLHTAYAVIFIYAIRSIAVLYLPSAVLNVVMVASTPTEGGHYLADVIGGLLVAFIAILIAERVRLFDHLRQVKLSREEETPARTPGNASCVQS